MELLLAWQSRDPFGKQSVITFNFLLVCRPHTRIDESLWGKRFLEARSAHPAAGYRTKKRRGSGEFKGSRLKFLARASGSTFNVITRDRSHLSGD
jgi:hypothetical protein